MVVVAQRTFEPGDRIDNTYRIVRRIGRGGMATVYEAIHERLGTRCALKVVRADEQSSPETALARFECEGRAAARLTSPHVARIVDIATTHDAISYMTMELLHGTELSEPLRDATVPRAHLLRWLWEACLGLEEAHRKGIVHRDLKPTNIFIANVNRARVAKLIDFGIAKILDENACEPTDSVIGTPLFMAPEQWLARPVDQRTDVFAMGVLLYRALSGRMPFGRSKDDVPSVLTGPAEDLSSIADVPADLSRVVMRAIERSAANRPATIGELARAIEPYISRLPVPRADLGTTVRVPRPRRLESRGRRIPCVTVKHHPLRMAAAVGSACAVVFAFTFSAAVHFSGGPSQASAIDAEGVIATTPLFIRAHE